MRFLVILYLLSEIQCCFWSTRPEIVEDKKTIASPERNVPIKVPSARPKSKKPKKPVKKTPKSDIQTEYLVSDEPSSMCKNKSGAWGQPCSYDIAVGSNCEEKQWWSDNGWTIYSVKCTMSKTKPGHSVRAKTVQTCSYGICHNGGGSGK